MPEILAPAGNFDSLKAAVVNGADAVYIGLDRFSARAKAENFSGDALAEAIDYAHLFGVKVYVAINTVIKNGELSDALDAAGRALDLGADALILQDLGLVSLIRQKYPDAILHASTQMGIHNAEGAQIAKELGFSRVILARETLLSDIIKIKKTVDIEVECFVQGALCIAFSGNCYFSSLASGYSGNRGKCMQLCRKKYTLGGREGYLLSAKDLSLAHKADKLIEAGVDCFKIEGRMRRPEYVAEAVRVYKKAVAGHFDREDLDCLKRVFNRGDYTEGHLMCGTAKVLDTDICSHRGLYLCKVVKVFGGKAKISGVLHKGDGVKFLRNGREVGAASVSRDGSETGFEGNVRAGDDVYITTDVEFNRAVLSRTRKLPVDVEANFDDRSLVVNCDGVSVGVELRNVAPAINSPVSENDIRDCFDKSTVFRCQKVVLSGAPSFMLRSDINTSRREAYDKLKAAILQKYRSEMPKFNGKYLSLSDMISGNIEKFLQGRTIYQVESPQQVKDDMEIVAINPREYSVGYLRLFDFCKDRALLSLPFVARGKDMEVLSDIVAKCDFAGYIVNNLYGLSLLRGRNVMLGYGMNIINDVIKVPKIYSFESDEIGSEGYVYARGNVPLMNFCHCPKKELLGGCKDCDGYDITLSSDDRKFKVRRVKIFYCYGQLLNCADLDITSRKIAMKFVDLSYERAGTTTKGNYERGLK